MKQLSVIGCQLSVEVTRACLTVWSSRWVRRARLARSHPACRDGEQDGKAKPAGFSLLEVILSLAILAGAVAVLGELVRLGGRHAQVARDWTQAQLLCESKLSELAASIQPLEACGSTSCENDQTFLYSINVEPLDDLQVVAVTVTVTQDPSQTSRPVEFSLVRWLVDREAQAEQDDANASTTDSTTTGGGSSGGTTSGSSGAGS